MTKQRDTTLDTLLELDGETFFVDEGRTHCVKFVVKRVPPTDEKPHGLDYSLTLHDKKNERIVGFDNAHAVPLRSGPSAKRRVAYDHKHRFRTVRPYDYRDAATLLADFWETVDGVLKEKGLIP